MTTYPSAPVDQQTADTLALIDMDRVHQTDRQIILDTIRGIATEFNGALDPNVLREWLTEGGECMVYHRTIGATIHGLARTGHLVAVGWTITTNSATGNNGKPARVYRVNSLPDDSEMA